MPSITQNQLYSDARQALTEFSDRFKDSLQQNKDFTTWSAEIGIEVVTDALKTVFPIPLDAPGFTEFKDDMKYRDLFERSLSMVEKTWQDGVKGKADKFERDFVGWLLAPENMATAARRAPNKWVTSLLEANPILEYYRDPESKTAGSINMFHAAHPVNPIIPDLGTFGNTGAAPVTADAAWLKQAKSDFGKVKGLNGDPLGLEMTHILTPRAREQEFKDLLENDILVQTVKNAAGTENVGGVGVNNRHKGTVQLIVGEELTSDVTFYTLAMNTGIYPWVMQRRATLEELLSDKSSQHYHDTLEVKLSYILRGNAQLALPHSIKRWS